MTENRAQLQKGDRAADFTLKDHNGEEFALQDFRGKKVLLSFHPLAWTSVCARQMQSLENNVDAFDSAGAIAVGVNVDPIPSKKAWAESLGIKKTRLLSDFWPHGEAAALYGLFREKDGFSERANVIVDENGSVLWAKVYPIHDLPDITEVLDQLK